MKEFSVLSFRDTIFESLLNSPLFPYMRDSETDRAKHHKRQPLHLKDAIRNNKMTFDGGEDTSGFEIGSSILENTHPYYHILQQAPVIRKRGKGTKKTKGSQANISDKGQRDYERVSWNGKTFTKEYSRNVRGSRLNLSNVTMNFDGIKLNDGANQYLNMHYKYIDEILDDIMPVIANEYGLKMKRKVDGGLGEEYGLQPESQYTTDIIDIISSHDIGDYNYDDYGY